MYILFAAAGDGATQPPPDLWQSMLYLIPMVLILIWGIWRRKKQASTKLQVVIGLLSNINHNMKVMEAYLKSWQAKKKFKTGNWKKHKESMDFLEPAVQTSINESFTIAEDFNQQIEVALKSGTASMLSALPVEKLREPLTKSKKGISEWLQANLQTEMYSRRRGLFG